MIGDFFKKKTSKKLRGERLGSEEYIDLAELVEDKGIEVEADVLIKVAEIHRYEDIRNVTDIVYDGHVLLVDVEDIAGNKEALTRVHSELKAVASDISGDVAGVGQNMIVVTPAGIGIDRKKIRPY